MRDSCLPPGLQAILVVVIYLTFYSVLSVSCIETCDDIHAHYDCDSPDYPYDCQNPAFTEATSLEGRPLSIVSTHAPVATPTDVPVATTTDEFIATPTDVPVATTTDEFIATPTNASSDPPVVLIVSEDATIMKSSPDLNNGLKPTLKVKLSTGPHGHDSLLRFIIPESGLSVSTAILKVYSLSNAADGGVIAAAASAPSDSSWYETSVTWNSAPELGRQMVDIGPVQEDRWITVDVSEVASGLRGKEGAITIRISSKDSRMVEYSSKEGSHPPEILITYSGEQNSSMGATSSVEKIDPIPVAASVSVNPVTPSSTTTPTAISSGPDLVLIPSDDATIVEGHADENYGKESTLQVDDDSGTYNSLIRFDLSDVDTSSVTSATLRLFCTDGADDGGIFGKTIDSNWDEASVTWKSAPAAFGAPFHSLGHVQEATWYDIDVTDVFFTAHNTLNAVSIRITSKSWNRAGYSSKEGSNPPQLVIQMDESKSIMENGALVSECQADTHLCPDGSVVSRVLEDGCNFAPCSHQADSGTGLFFPVWRSGGTVACVKRSSPPSWASGAYLKESKSDCCEAYSMLRINECLRA